MRGAFGRGGFGRNAFGRDENVLGRAFGRNARRLRLPNVLRPGFLGPHAVTFTRASQAFDPHQTLENLAPYSELDVDTNADGIPNGWSFYSASGGVVTSTVSASGLRQTVVGTGLARSHLHTSSDYPVVPGDSITATYTLGAVEATNVDSLADVVIDWRNSAGTNIGYVFGVQAVPTSDATRTATGTAPANTASARVGFRVFGNTTLTVRRAHIQRGTGSYIETDARPIPRYHRDNDVPRTRQIGAYHEWQLEPSRTNVFTYSTDHTHADWVKSEVTVTGKAVDGPYANTKADHIAETATLNVRHETSRAVLRGSSSITYVYREILKAGERTQVELAGHGSSNADICTATFDLSAGTIAVAAAVAGTYTAPLAGIKAVGNGFYDCWIAFTTDVGTYTAFLHRPVNGGSNLYSGGPASGYYVWHSEASSGVNFPTSPIITTTAAVNRFPDDADVAATLTAGDMLLATKSFTTGLWSYVWISHAGGAYQVPNSNGVILLHYGRTLTAAEKQSESDTLEAALVADGQSIDAGWV